MFKIFKKLNIIKPLSIILACSVLSLSFNTRKETVTLRAGTPIPMETTTALSSNYLIIGRTVDFKVTQDIMVDGNVVVPVGSIAKGQVIRVERAKGLGKAGYIAVEVKSVKAVDGTIVQLGGGDIYNEGEDKQTLAIVLGIAVCILFLTMKGKDALVPAGYDVTPLVAISAEIDA